MWCPTPASPASATAPLVSAITNFHKGVKLSVSDYKPFKEDRFLNSWQCHLQITARSHNVDNVINMAYIRANLDNASLLNEQKKFVFSVLEQTVLTPDGVLIIHQHSDTGDATAVYLDLVDRYSKSTAAQLAASELEMELTEFRIDASWIKTNLAFLLACTTKSLDLDAVLEQPITESQKRIWFIRAVPPRPLYSLWLSPNLTLPNASQLLVLARAMLKQMFLLYMNMLRMSPHVPIKLNALLRSSHPSCP
jgi:hypothetical protein